MLRKIENKEGFYKLESIANMGRFMRAMKNGSMSIDDFYPSDSDSYAFRFKPSKLGIGYHLQNKNGNIVT